MTPDCPATKNRAANNIKVRMMGASQNFLRTRIKAQISLNVSIGLSLDADVSPRGSIVDLREKWDQDCRDAVVGRAAGADW
jgi:hypothetical protein